MIQLIKSLTVVSALSVFAFWVSSNLFQHCLPKNQIFKWLFAWLALSAAGFLTANFWLYAMLGAIIILALALNEQVKPALFLLLLPLFPIVNLSIPGLGVINNLIELNHARLILILIVFSQFLEKFIAQPNSLRNCRIPGFMLILYVILLICLEFRGSSITNVMRVGVIFSLDVLAPFFLFSNYIRRVEEIIVCMVAFITAILAHSLMATFETAKFWKLFIELHQSWILIPIVDPYLTRDGLLRAATSAESPIVLGFMIMISIGLLYGLKYRVSNKKYYYLSYLILAAGLFSALSRGPWLATAIMIFVFLIFERNRVIKNLSKLVMLCALLSPLLLTPPGQRVLSLLPFVGTVETGNIDYRETLLENATIVILRNPILGSENYLSTPELEKMRQGQGIIDIVNSYVAIALEAGFVGLALFCMVFLAVIVAIFRTTRRLPENCVELIHLGKVQIGIIVGMMVTIATVSSISFVPYLYWSLLGLGVAYVRVASQLSPAPTSRRMRVKNHTMAANFPQ